jgi:hypothetical protein|tara:strand:- start:529 stop:798 length:270 start_codon:yes stop_codon:yes gene_type:complete
MAKKLNDPSEGNKNLGVQKRGIASLIDPSKKQQKEKETKKDQFDTVDVKQYSLLLPTWMYQKLKFDLAKEKESSIRNLILEAIQAHYKL